MWGFDYCGDDEGEARSAMVESIFEPDWVLEENLQQSLAHDKTLVVASSRTPAPTVAHDFEMPTSGVVSSARNLGIVDTRKRGGRLALVRMSRLLKA